MGLVLLLQGPAMLTQEIAWAGMLVTYTRDRGLARGLVETFDGEHPCEMCLKAAKMKQGLSGGDPLEKRREPATFTRLSWAEMVPPKWLAWKNPPGTDLSIGRACEPIALAGRGKEAPVPPPPRLA